MEFLKPLVRIREAKPLEEFCMLLEFEDGTQKEIDLEPYLRGPIFEPIRRDPAMFRDVRIEGGTIAWSNGADIDPDVLYYNLKPVWMENLESVTER
jgi:hypothetical protein